jgi:ammonium transporter, Amt family
MAELLAVETVLFSALSWLVPIGIALLAIGAAHEEQAERVAATSLIALAAALCGYLFSGFAFQYGGVATVSGLAGLRGLTAEWSPLDTTWGPGWGLVGLRGFLLRGDAYQADVYLLFAAQASIVTTAVLVTLLALCTRIRRIHLLPIGLLVSSLLYPILGNWVVGGGWLANLGQNLDLGHGFVDIGGIGTLFLLGACVALAVFSIRKPRRTAEPVPAALPPIHFPLLVVAGALLAVAGWPGLILANPLLSGNVSAPVILVNLGVAAAGGALVTSVYTWFVTSEPNALCIARGTVAGLVAASAACAFVPAGAALLIGAVAGLLMIIALYAWEQVLKLRDPSACVATFGVPAVWGILALSVFADGRWGAGWNGVASKNGQGVSGRLIAGGYQLAGPGQFQAQVTGLAATLVVGLLLPWLLMKFVLWFRNMGQPEEVLTISTEDTAVAVEPTSEPQGLPTDQPIGSEEQPLPEPVPQQITEGLPETALVHEPRLQVTDNSAQEAAQPAAAQPRETTAPRQRKRT